MHTTSRLADYTAVRFRDLELVSVGRVIAALAESPGGAIAKTFATRWPDDPHVAAIRTQFDLQLAGKAAVLPSGSGILLPTGLGRALVEAAAPFLRDAGPVGEPHARTSTAVLNEAVAGEDWIRVGDAAMAVDPLSGNGIFQALSSALQAPAVVATLRHDPSSRTLAQRFHHQRIEHLFYRFARIGRDFYARETRWPQAPFWAHIT